MKAMRDKAAAPCCAWTPTRRTPPPGRLYARLGYREAGIVPCVFNGIKGVGLVCLEKKL